MKLLFTIFITSIAIVCNAQLPKMENGKLILDKAVTFKTGGDELTDEGKEALAQVKEFLVQKDYITTLRVEGHTDNAGVETDNQSLTEKRALLFVNGLLKMALIANV